MIAECYSADVYCDCESHQYGTPGDMSMPPLNDEAFQQLGLSYEQIDRALEQAETEYVAGVDIFTGGG